MIEIPDPVIAVESTTDTSNRKYFQFTVTLVIGREPVMERTFHDDYERYDQDDYAEDSEDAQRKLLDEFGRKLKALLQ